MSAAPVLVIPLGAQDGPKRDDAPTVAKPRKKGSATDDSSLPAVESEINKAKKEKGDVSSDAATFSTDTNVVNVDVAVIDSKGRFIPNIPKGNFRILEDDVPQKLTNYSLGEAPMTVLMVIEFSAKFQQYLYGPAWYQTLTAAYGFAETLRPDDYVAVMAYDMRPTILSDFTTDRRKTQEALGRLRIAAFSEANLFDALIDAQERMKNIEGRKAIVLLSSGIDTFSKVTFDKTRKILQQDGVPIYAIGLMQAIRIAAESRGAMGPIQQMDFLQADNEMKTFAKETGGQSFFPRFYGEFPSIFQNIQQALRNQYSLAYQPTNQAKDGKFRKIKVELVNPETGEPLRVVEDGKPVKYQIIAKAGYNGPRAVE